MKNIILITNNKGKIEQAEKILGGVFRTTHIPTEVSEMGFSTIENARLKLIKFLEAKPVIKNRSIVVADDYALELENSTISSYGNEGLIKYLSEQMKVETEKILDMPFPDIFAHRILDFLKNESLLFKKISELGWHKGIARVSLAVFSEEKVYEITRSVSVRLSKTLSKNPGWFWSKAFESSEGVSCLSQEWKYGLGPRANALNELKNK